MKRVCLAMGCFYLKKELVAIFLGIQMAHISYLLHTMPYIDRYVLKTELGTEFTLLGLLFVLQAFKGDLMMPD
jgi:hypothetical protein